MCNIWLVVFASGFGIANTYKQRQKRKKGGKNAEPDEMRHSRGDFGIEALSGGQNEKGRERRERKSER